MKKGIIFERVEKMYKADILSIDAWKEAEGGWTWNNSFYAEKDIYIDESMLTPRKIFKLLRKLDILSEYSKGKVSLEEQWPIFEIQNKNTFEPLFALIIEEQ